MFLGSIWESATSLCMDYKVCYNSMQILKTKLKIFEQSFLGIVLEMHSFTKKRPVLMHEKMLIAANFRGTRHQCL